MRQFSRKITYILAVLTVVSAVCGCSGGNSPAPVVTESAPASVSESTAKASETEESVTSADTEPSDSETTEEPEPQTEAPESTPDTDAPAETETTEAVTTEETTESGTPEATATAAPETTTVTTTAETAAATTTVTTTAAATTAAPAASPSPPKINEVSSPGTSTFRADNIVFDYSNAGKGYVSVDYSGTTRLKLLLKLGSGQFDYDIYPGRGVQYITLAQGSGTYTVEIYEMLDNGKFINSVNETFAASIADEVNMFTYRNFYVEFNANSKCVAKASEVCAGCNTALDKIAAVFKYVTDNITYDKQKAATVTSGYIPDPDRVLAEKKGICFDYASLTAAMLRSQGVPARLITGYANPNIYHAWNEVYSPDTGWITVEIMLDGTGFRRIDATFYASAANKQSFADYIANSSNYSNVYIY